MIKQCVLCGGAFDALRCAKYCATCREKLNPELFWAKVAKAKPCDCWQWLGDMRGFGWYSWNRTTRAAHACALELHLGRPVKYARHTCGNLGCCNPKHLQECSAAEHRKVVRLHMSGRKAIGARNGATKLTEAQVREIRQSKLSQRLIALQFQVSKSTVRDIQRKRIWRHVDG